MVLRKCLDQYLSSDIQSCNPDIGRYDIGCCFFFFVVVVFVNKSTGRNHKIYSIYNYLLIYSIKLQTFINY